MAIYETWDREEIEYYYIQENYTIGDLADLLNSSESTVKRGLKYFGISKGRGRGRRAASPFEEEPEFTESSDDFGLDLSREDVEFNIRKAIQQAIPEAPTKLIDMLPVGYDADEDLWIINDYKSSKKGHDLPIEVHMKYNTSTGKYEVISFEVRGKSDKKLMAAFQKAL